MNTPVDQMILTRTDFTDKSTIGDLFIDGRWQCYILEPSCRKFPGQILAISQGKFEVVMYESPRMKAKVQRWKSEGKILTPVIEAARVPLLLKVPNHEYVEMHPGNGPGDTHDCLCPGLAKDHDYVMNSRVAWEALVTKIEAKLAQGKFYIGITGGGI